MVATVAAQQTQQQQQQQAHGHGQLTTSMHITKLTGTSGKQIRREKIERKWLDGNEYGDGARERVTVRVSASEQGARASDEMRLRLVPASVLFACGSMKRR